VSTTLSFGLSALPPSVARTLATVYGHHRTPWFDHILENIVERLVPALGAGYTPLFLTCTQSGGREAAVANLVRPSARVLATPGDFARLALAWGAEVQTLPAAGLGQEVVPDTVLVEHLSPSGTLLDVAALVASVRAVAPEAPIVLDASTSFGVDFVDVQASGVDAILIVPERGLMSIPGVTVFAVNDRFVDTLGRRRADLPDKPFLFDLLRYHRAWAKQKTTPYSPNISACVGLQAALALIDANGGLRELHRTHEARAASIRTRLKELGYGTPPGDALRTNAWTPFELPAGIVVGDVLADLAAAGVDVRQHESGAASVDIAHAGYIPDDALKRLFSAAARLAGIEQSGVSVAASRLAEESAPVEAPFSIDPREFLEQANHHASKNRSGARVRAKVADSARRVFRDRHIVHEEALRHRTVGFVGAGRIVKSAVDLCLERGITNLMVYSPSLADVEHGRASSEEARRRAGEWKARGVKVAGTLEELSATSHAVVLLPVPYDDASLKLFRKAPQYHNHGFLNEPLLDHAERAGRLDLVINAAAREALVDRSALARAVGAGWLRYYSDEMPSEDDPLLDFDGVRYTAHVGGSCRAPQAAVARNTHTILRRLIARMLGMQSIGQDPAAPANDTYTLSVVNGHLLGESSTSRLESAVRDVRKSNRLRILLTDPFDVESLAFNELRQSGLELDVRDVSSGQMSAARLAEVLAEVRPHIVMLRSRTRVDAAAAQTMVGIEELAFVIRPGVGVDNLYGGMERLSEAGVQIINEPYGNSRAVAEMAVHFILSGTETTLLAPGPTNFNAVVFDVASTYDHVRLAQPARTAAHVNQVIGKWLGAQSDAITVSGPGTALMEASIANLTLPGSRGLVISHGKFGDRFVDIANARGRTCDVLRVEEDQWGAAVAPEDVARFLQADFERRSAPHPPVSFLCFQQNETSSGVTYHQDSIRALVRIARAYNPEMVVIADAISGALAHPLAFDALDLDILFLGSQKALGVSSGLAFAVLSERAIRLMLSRAGYEADLDAFCDDPAAERHFEELDRRQRVHSINLLRTVAAARRQRLVDTPSLFHLMSTERALELFEEEGGAEAVAARHAELAAMVRDGVRRLGLELMPRPPFESDSVTVVILPQGIDASAIRKAVARNTAIAIAGAQGDFWKRRMLRIGTLGFVTRSDVARCLRGLRIALAEMGYVPSPAAADFSLTAS
jgi:aspartate aminotransferase-like enzyme/lactate dehydrogenase-like 2-hydroxyacid dehydrogenase